MKLFLLLFVSFLLGCSTESTEKSAKTSPIPARSAPNTTKSYKVIYTDEIGWGYQIFDGNKMMINQKHIPAIQGLKGFETKEKAETTAKYILNQIQSGVFPPTVTATILDSLGVL